MAINSVGQGHNSLLESNPYPGFRGRPNSLYFQMTTAEGESRPSQTPGKIPSSGFANNKSTDQPAHSPILIHAFVIRLLESLS